MKEPTCPNIAPWRVTPAALDRKKRAVDFQALRARAVDVMRAHSLPPYREILESVAELRRALGLLAADMEERAARLADIPLRETVLRTVAEARTREKRGLGHGLVSAHDLSRSLAGTVVVLIDVLSMLEDRRADEE